MSYGCDGSGHSPAHGKDAVDVSSGECGSKPFALQSLGGGEAGVALLTGCPTAVHERYASGNVLLRGESRRGDVRLMADSLTPLGL